MVSLPFRESDLADEVNAFAAKIEPAKDRWLYCLDRASYQKVHRGSEYVCLNERTMPVCDRIIGCYKGTASSRLAKIKEFGWDGAQEWVAGRTWLAQRPYFYVGPMQAWHVGHVYFAAVESHPHVVKIGFSRRVRERLEDIESQHKTKLFVPRDHLFVGTMADEHWWHRERKAHHISGEWFLHPEAESRELPDFLQSSIKRAA